ncbi:esterase family protein [Desulfuribacillus alkaliarsenatis]|uniref:Esterase n=1 Tax=Desulfuribacillus alkaliarsenatis TaxID=766136 RepID=A0A1E5FZC6_9FIRM|nr:alpha/beta hydrolase-fold protein [Desulfuribacillus alkaliarsenatis]OEF95852.1 hypothetical protein BHF68_10675 [Desulfuribacillus alkaliarsenatis]
MKVDYKAWYSKELGQKMEFKIYGDSGKPVLAFPATNGRFYDFENFGIIDACKDYIANGQIQLYTLDSVDQQSWLNKHISAQKKVARHKQYVSYIMKEIVPFIQNNSTHNGSFMVTGCGMGGYHSANFYFRYPNIFDSMISLSGLYSLDFAVGDYVDEDIYFNSPIAYLTNLTDANYLNKYCGGCIVIATGQGAGYWEEQSLKDVYALKGILEQKNIFAWVDIWGHDVTHDWYWWRKMLPYFLSHCGMKKECRRTT